MTEARCRSPLPMAIGDTYPELSVGARWAPPPPAKGRTLNCDDPGRLRQGALRAGPRPRSVVDEHLSDHGEVLLHLLTADLCRLLRTAFEQGDGDLLHRGLALVDRRCRQETKSSGTQWPCPSWRTRAGGNPQCGHSLRAGPLDFGLDWSARRSGSREERSLPPGRP